MYRDVVCKGTTRLVGYGSTGYPPDTQASKPPRIGLTREKPFCSMMNAARALVSSAGQVQ